MISDKKRKILETSLCENSLLIMVGKVEILRNGDVFYPFRQDSDFLLLTGVNIPELRLVARKRKKKTEWILYSNPISEKEKLWGTNRLSYQELREKTGISEIRGLEKWKSDVREFGEESENIYIKHSDKKILGRELSKYKKKLIPLEEEILPLRMIKTEEEIEKTKRAISITKIALDEVEKNMNSYVYEGDIEADIARVYRKNGCTEAYPTIVASGPNACILHYTNYNRKIEDGDFVLIDTGAEYEGYAADITRTFMKGKGKKQQNHVYEVVLAVQIEAIANIKPGRTWDEHEKIMREIMNRYLIKLDLLRKEATGEEQTLISRKYFPHRMSHFLGLDVHDSGESGDTLEPGMIITCEPGIYIHEEGIGVRIEDDILITENGCEVLSGKIPK